MNQNRSTSAAPPPIATEQVMRAGTSPMRALGDISRIDQVFDFWEKSLEAQRTVAKQLVGASISAGEKVREQVGVGERRGAPERGLGRPGPARAGRLGHRHVQSAAAAVREQAAKTYDDLNKAELQEELGARNLPKTGTVDELRERLVADDLK